MTGCHFRPMTAMVHVTAHQSSPAHHTAKHSFSGVPVTPLIKSLHASSRKSVSLRYFVSKRYRSDATETTFHYRYLISIGNGPHASGTMVSVEIKNCMPCGLLGPAVQTQRTLLETFGHELDEVSLKNRPWRRLQSHCRGRARIRPINTRQRDSPRRYRRGGRHPGLRRSLTGSTAFGSDPSVVTMGKPTKTGETRKLPFRRF